MRIPGIYCNFLWLAILISCFGCSKPSSSGLKERVDEQTVNIAITQHGIPSWATAIVSDSHVLLVTDEWIQDRFIPEWNFFKSKYITPGSDCDDYARGAAFLAQQIQRKPLDHNLSFGIAFGEFWYPTGRGTNHALNFFLVRESTNVVIKFFEPLYSQVVYLKPEDVKKCLFWRL